MQYDPRYRRPAAPPAVYYYPPAYPRYDPDYSGVASAAIVCAVMVPPVGFALGIFVANADYSRARRDNSTQGKVAILLSLLFMVVYGLAMLSLLTS